MKNRPGRPLKGDGQFHERILAALPYSLTAGQKQAVADILADMAAPHRMLRLLQGDVGSGKTAVALIAMVAAVEAGAQATLMAPTELLARQHFNAIQPLAEKIGFETELITGRLKGKKRSEVLERLERGDVHIVIGT